MNKRKLITTHIRERDTDEIVFNVRHMFKEMLYNPYEIPVSLSRRTLINDEDFFFHHSDCFEMVVFENVTGEIFISNRTYKIEKNEAYIIPPSVVHGSKHPKSEGKIYVFNINLDFLEKYVNIKNIFGWEDYSFSDKVPKLDIYNEIIPVINDLLANDYNMAESIRKIVSIFEIIDNATKHSKDSLLNINHVKNINFKKLLQWTQEHYLEKISVDDAAEMMHFNKFHFCKYFKNMTGISYINYINQLKIQYAITLLMDGKSATDCCMMCGFDNVSYFIRLFKKITGMTTKEYIKKYSSDKNLFG